jgi:hypothetical protein
MIDGSGRLLRRIDYPTDPFVLHELVLSRVCFASPTTMVSRHAFEEVGGFRRLFEPAEDVDFCIRVSDRFAVSNLEEPLVRYRIHGDNISMRAVRRQMEGVLVAQAAARRRRGGHDDPTATAETLAIARGMLGIDEEQVNALTFESILLWIELLATTGPDWRRHELAAQARSLIPSVADPESSLQRLEHALAHAPASAHDQKPTKNAASADGLRLVLGAMSAGFRRTRHLSLRAAALVYTGMRILTSDGPGQLARRVAAWRDR